MVIVTRGNIMPSSLNSLYGIIMGKVTVPEIVPENEGETRQ